MKKLYQKYVDYTGITILHLLMAVVLTYGFIVIGHLAFVAFMSNKLIDFIIGMLIIMWFTIDLSKLYLGDKSKKEQKEKAS